MEKEEFFEKLKQSLKSDDDCERYEAAILIGAPETVDLEKSYDLALLLHPLLKDRHDHVRYYAAVSIGNLGYKESLPFLKNALPVVGLEIISEKPTTKGIEGVEDAINWAIKKIEGFKE